MIDDKSLGFGVDGLTFSRFGLFFWDRLINIENYPSSALALPSLNQTVLVWICVYFENHPKHPNSQINYADIGGRWHAIYLPINPFNSYR